MRWGTRLFVTPFNMPLSETGKKFIDEASHFTLQVNGVEVRCYRMGAGPEIIMVHGWAGKAAQFYAMAKEAVNRGYQVLSFDAQGHGMTKGNSPNMFEFAAGLKALVGECQDLRAVIGHSMGAASTSYAIANGLAIPRFISMGSPAVAAYILQDFCNTINASHQLADAIRERCLKEFGMTFESVSMEQTIRSVNCPVLAIHGDEDKDAGIQHLHQLKAAKPTIHTHVAQGLGHRRILKDPVVMDKVFEFIDG